MAPQRRVTHSELTYQHTLTADTISHPSAWSSSLEEPLSPGWEQDTKSQGSPLIQAEAKITSHVSKSKLSFPGAQLLPQPSSLSLPRDGSRAGQRGDVGAGTCHTQSSTLSCSLQMPGDGHPSLSWRKRELATHHEDAGDDEIVGATLQHFQPSQSPSPGKAGRGRLLNTPTGVMAQHQTQLGCGDGEISIKAQSQQAAKWVHTDSWSGD